MKKKINNELTLYYNNLFPYKTLSKSKYKNKITLGIGGNIGDTIKRFNRLFISLRGDSRFSIIQTSPILKNPPFGYIDQEYFYNAIIVLKTDLSPFEALRAFQRYENRFKRVRTFQDAPRTLDLDIIFFNNIKLKTKNLTLPHHGYKGRESVTIPLSFIATN